MHQAQENQEADCGPEGMSLQRQCPQQEETAQACIPPTSRGSI